MEQVRLKLMSGLPPPLIISTWMRAGSGPGGGAGGGGKTIGRAPAGRSGAMDETRERQERGHGRERCGRGIPEE